MRLNKLNISARSWIGEVLLDLRVLEDRESPHRCSRVHRKSCDEWYRNFPEPDLRRQ